jgi:hypothetical protein
MTDRYEKQNGVTFHEGYRLEDSSYSELPKSSELLINHSGGLIKNTKQAQYALVLLFLILLAVSFFLFTQNGTKIPKEALVNPEYGLPVVD